MGTVERASEVEANLGLGFVPIYKSSASTEPWVIAYLSLKVSLYKVDVCVHVCCYLRERVEAGKVQQKPLMLCTHT